MSIARLCLVLVFCLGMVSPALSDTIEVAYSFGKIELLRQGDQEWQFLKKGTKLDAQDRVRTPPISILRLTTSELGALPIFTGVRESLVANLLDDARHKLQLLRTSQMASPSWDGAAIDVLPTGEPLDETQLEQQQVISTISPDLLALMQKEMYVIPKAVREKSLKWRMGPMTASYGSEPVQTAIHFYHRLMNETQDHPVSERLLTYARLLIASGIEVKLISTDQNQPILLIDSSLTPQQAPFLTINQSLTLEQEGRAWIPLYLGYSSAPFVAAWYDGARMIRSEYVEK